MNKRLVLGMVLLFLSGLRTAQADSATPVATPAMVKAAGASNPAPTSVKKSKKKKALSAATPSGSPTPQVSTTPVAKEKTEATPSPTLLASGTNSSSVGDQAYAAKDFAKAQAAYADEIQKKGKTPELEKKFLLSKFYAGQALTDEARKGLKDEENYYKSDEESHNLMIYGKRQPSRGAHLVTLSLAILTPQLLGGDIGFTFLSHINVGMGIGFMGVDPRIKYYFDGDNASFFVGAGFATYDFSLSGSFDLGGGNGSLNGKISGTFAHFTFGPSFQDKNGFFMEMPVDVGIANINGSGSANGGNNSGGSGGSGSTNSSGSGNYNGLMGTIGFRFGYSI